MSRDGGFNLSGPRIITGIIPCSYSSAVSILLSIGCRNNFAQEKVLRSKFDEMIAALLAMSIFELWEYAENSRHKNVLKREIGVLKQELLKRCEACIGKKPDDLPEILPKILMQICVNVIKVPDVVKSTLVKKRAPNNKGHYWRIFSALVESEVIGFLETRDYYKILSTYSRSKKVATLCKTLSDAKLLTYAIFKALMTNSSGSVTRIYMLEQFLQVQILNSKNILAVFKNARLLPIMKKAVEVFQRNGLSMSENLQKIVDYRDSLLEFLEVVDSMPSAFPKKTRQSIVQGLVAQLGAISSIQYVLDQLKKSSLSVEERWGIVFSDPGDTKPIVKVLIFLIIVFPQTTDVYFKTLPSVMRRFFTAIHRAIPDWCSLRFDEILQSRQVNVFRALREKGILTIENWQNMFISIPDIYKLLSSSPIYNTITLLLWSDLLSQANYLNIIKELGNVQYPFGSAIAYIVRLSNGYIMSDQDVALLDQANLPNVFHSHPKKFLKILLAKCWFQSCQRIGYLHLGPPFLAWLPRGLLGESVDALYIANELIQQNAIEADLIKIVDWLSPIEILGLWVSGNNFYKAFFERQLLQRCEEIIGSRPEDVILDISIGMLVILIENLMNAKTHLERVDLKLLGEIEQMASKGKGHLWNILSLLIEGNIISELTVENYVNILSAFRSSRRIYRIFQLLHDHNKLTVHFFRSIIEPDGATMLTKIEKILLNFVKYDNMTIENFEKLLTHYECVEAIYKAKECIRNSDLYTAENLKALVNNMTCCEFLVVAAELIPSELQGEKRKHIIQNFIEHIGDVQVVQRVYMRFRDSGASDDRIKKVFLPIFSDPQYIWVKLRVLLFLNRHWRINNGDHFVNYFTNLCGEVEKTPDAFKALPNYNLCGPSRMGHRDKAFEITMKNVELIFEMLRKAGIVTLGNWREIFKQVPDLTQLLSQPSVCYAIELMISLGKITQNNCVMFFNMFCRCSYPLGAVVAWVVNKEIGCKTPEQYLALLNNKGLSVFLIGKLLGGTESLTAVEYFEFLKKNTWRLQQNAQQSNVQSMHPINTSTIPQIESPYSVAAMTPPITQQNTQGSQPINLPSVPLSASSNTIHSENKRKNPHTKKDQSQGRKRQRISDDCKEYNNCNTK